MTSSFIKRLVCSVLFFTAMQGVIAQIATPVILEENSIGERASCSNQFAGTIYLNNFSGNSNDSDFDTIYLCFGDEFTIFHNGDQNLNGDSNPTTPGGIGYAWYTQRPVQTGPMLSDVISDPAVFTHPSVPGSDLIVYVDDPSGRARFSNSYVSGTQTFNDFYNSGSPTQLWFAPITFDQLSGSTAVYEDGNNSCVHSNVAEAFSVVYLNQISYSNLVTGPGQATFRVGGGLPEFNPAATYSITVTNLWTGVVQTFNNVTHNELVNVVIANDIDLYQVNITDGKSCPYSFTFNGNYQEDNVTFILNGGVVEPNSTTCFPITVQNFDDILAITIEIGFDPSVFRLNNIHLGPNATGNFSHSDQDSDKGTFILTFEGPLSLDDDEILFNICLDAIGLPGDCSPLQFEPRILPEFEIANSNAEVLHANYINTTICISAPNNIEAYVNTCSTSGNDGSIEFTIFGGAPPYKWTLFDEFNVSQDTGVVNIDGEIVLIETLMHGQYRIELTDAQGNMYSQVIQIINQPRLEIETLMLTNPDCTGNSGGQIWIDVNGGVGTNPFVLWTNGEYDTYNLTQLSAGIYGVTVTDDMGCSVSEEYHLNAADFVLDPLTLNNETCSNSQDGTAQAVVNGALPTANYRFEWSNGVITNGPSSTITNLSAGNYQVTVYDAGNCFVIEDFEILTGKVITGTVTAVSPSCYGDSDGTITVRGVTTPTGGSNYSFQWSPNAGNYFSMGPVSVLGNLVAGEYSITITDGDGCSEVVTYSLTEPDELNIDIIESVLPDCVGGNGIIEVDINGGTAPYQLLWNTGATDNRLTDLNPGDYTLTVTDANSCEAVLELNWDSGDVQVDFNISEITCSGLSDGQIIANINPGSATITSISWSTNAGTPVTSGIVSTVNSLRADVYILNVTTSDGCVGTFNVQLQDPIEAYLSNVNLFNPSCPGVADGSVIIEISGSNAPFSAFWPELNSVGTIQTNLAAGTYTVNLMDANNCPVVSEVVTLVDRSPIQVEFVENQPLSCDQSLCNGELTAIINGGGAGAYDLTWSNGQTGTGSMMTLQDLCEGQYTLTVSDGNCVTEFTYDFYPQSDIVFILNNETPVSCFGESDGSISGMGSGGAEPYQYQWSNSSTTNSANNLTSGTYTVTITDALGCSAVFSHTIGEPEPFNVEINPELTQNLSCGNIPDGSIGLILTGGNAGPIQYMWSPNVSNTEFASGLSAGHYSIAVIDSKNCIAYLEHDIVGPTPIEFVIPEPDQPLCFGEFTTMTVASATGGSGMGYTFSINGAPPQPLGSYLPVLAGNHQIEIFDSNNCSVQTTIRIDQPSEIDVYLPDEIVIRLGEERQLIPVVGSLLPVDNYRWTPILSIDNPLVERPLVNPVEDMLYTLTVTDINGCTGVGSVFVRVNKVKNIYIPNAFAPNKGGQNGVFEMFPDASVAKINRVHIYNRWGDLMVDLHSPDVSTGRIQVWDGFYRGRFAPVGVYVYAVEVEFVDGEIAVLKGDVTILD